MLERTNANKTDWYKVNANINTTGVGAANYQTGYVMASFLHVMTAEEQAQWLQNPTAKYQPGGAAQPTAVPAVPTAIPALVTATPAQSAGAILGYVVNFARTGDPNGPGLPAWAADGESRTLLELGSSVQMMDEKYLALYAVMDRMDGWE